jgi:hypothetical protein
MSARYRGWALFYAACLFAIGSYVVGLASNRAPGEDRWRVAALGLVALLAGARFAAAGLTGRIPSWLATFIDADK